ncbi:MAG: bacteriophage abortive infection AbiH family protein [Agathobacter sp.]
MINGLKPKHLYVIGNGFDRYHGAQSSYRNFRQYMLRRNPNVVAQFDVFFAPNTLRNTFKYPEGWKDAIDDRSARWYYGKSYPQTKWSEGHLWCSFEEYLAELNREKVLEFIDMNLPLVNSDAEDFSLADYYLPIDRTRPLIRECTFEMRYLLHKWVNTLHFAKGWKTRKLDLDADAIYLTFNYTTFLEDLYEIPWAQVCHIHGSRKDKFGSLVIGHGQEENIAFERWKHKCASQKRFRPNLKDKNGRWFANDHLPFLMYFLQDETKGNWRTDTRYYASCEADEVMEQYYAQNRKQTESIVNKFGGLWQSLDEVQKVTVIGHSLSEVDMLYFKQIVRGLGQRRVEWKFSVYNKRDKERVRHFCRMMKIPKDSWTMFRL